MPPTRTGWFDPRVFDFEADLGHVADGYRAMGERRSIKALVGVSTLGGR